LDIGRKRRRRPALSLDDGIKGSSETGVLEDPAAGLNRQDLRRALEAALNRLSPSTRATFVLFAEAGLSYQQIADCQQLPVGTVMSRLHYARQKLQGFLSGIEVAS
jgi:RNA polymerase sigma-70 factor (ECF subfamily)